MSDAFDLAAGARFSTILRRVRSTRYDARFAFRVGILISMLAPLLIYFMHTEFTNFVLWQPFWFLIPLIGVLSGTHVFATTYLYVRPGSFRGVQHRFLLLYLMPAVIILFNVYAATLLPLGYLLAFMLVYVHYALFHFGRQNLGVLSFVTLTSMRRPMQRREKLILNGVVACGMLSALKLFPTVMLDPAKHPIDLVLIGRVATVLHDIGYAGYALVLALAAYQFFTNRRAYDTYSAIVYWLSVVWYLPIYVALQYPLLSLAAFTTAHGLQYLVFLGMHAYSDARRGLGRRPGFDRTAGPALSPRLLIAAVPCLLLLAAIYSGYYIWQQSPVLFSDWSGTLDRWFGAGGVATVGASLVAGLTLAHYWVDQFIWRFRSPERKKWLLENFAFLSG